ncbi:MAG TPA: glycerophosphodiester phosphodiesterase [Methylibium sp.]|uniref:glycerophosphodiester phosphodiesterase n=1 Tax=Methylibium sp. TaxID=2067992 RepID=UPI002DBA9059|nr:glycerophosphodiester phosphodiesterase [Methylibium sp.]HEU4457738.1 glycerophosphodiester phosphodiesterase [Methylibium sp.]
MKLPRPMRTLLITAAVALAGSACAMQPAANFARHEKPAPIVIGHRGASGYVPEHTLAAYWLAIEQGADYVEPDLVATKDGVLVARHENAIAILNADGSIREATTDIAERPEFASRKTTKSIDGVAITGWFTEDLTLAELKTLRARERLPALRVANTRFDGMFEVPTLEEILQLVEQANERRRNEAKAEGRKRAKVAPIGVYPETKHPSYFQGIGLPLEEPLVQLLNRYGYKRADSAVFVQSFEVANLRKLRSMTRVPLVQLYGGATARPWDFVVAKDPRTYGDLAKPVGLAEVAGYAQGIGPATTLIVPLTATGTLGIPGSLVQDAHAAGLKVHPYTFRAENNFLPNEFDRGSEPGALGDLAGQIEVFLKLGIDGFFTDHPFLGKQARDAFVGRR